MGAYACFDLQDYEFIENLTNLEIIKLPDLKHVKYLPDLSNHTNLQRVFLINTGINMEGLPVCVKDKISNPIFRHFIQMGITILLLMKNLKMGI